MPDATFEVTAFDGVIYLATKAQQGGKPVYKLLDGRTLKPVDDYGVVFRIVESGELVKASSPQNIDGE